MSVQSLIYCDFVVDVSQETEEQTDLRLGRVIRLAEMVVRDGIWYFQESPASSPPLLSGQTLAVVRDEDSWSALVPLVQEPTEPVESFGVFSFHFPTGVDNSGFVGWLATHLKRRLGTGVFVVCGSNRARVRSGSHLRSPATAGAVSRHRALPAADQCATLTSQA